MCSIPNTKRVRHNGSAHAGIPGGSPLRGSPEVEPVGGAPQAHKNRHIERVIKKLEENRVRIG